MRSCGCSISCLGCSISDLTAYFLRRESVEVETFGVDAGAGAGILCVGTDVEVGISGVEIGASDVGAGTDFRGRPRLFGSVVDVLTGALGASGALFGGGMGVMRLASSS